MTYGMGTPTGPAGSSSGQKQASGVTKEKIPSGYKKSAVQTYTPEMMQLWQSLFPHLGPDSYLARLAGGDQSLFDEIEAPAFKQFQGLQGDIASRFSGQGMGARHGSGFQNQMNQSTQDFAMGLQSKRQEMMMQAIHELMGLSGGLLNMNPYDVSLQEKEKPWWQQFLSNAAPGVSQQATKKALSYI